MLDTPQTAPQPKTGPVITYFCMEFATDDEFGIYSGGLGVLAGDLMLEAGARHAQLIGVGLAYALTYKQVIAKDGRQLEEDLPIDPEANGLKLVTDAQGKPVVVTVPIQDREVKIQAWEKSINGARLILLDTNLPANETQDQHITNQLYIGDREHRLLQEMVLGIGGARVIHALGIEPDIYHMNEGHSAFLALEVANYYRLRTNQENFAKTIHDYSSKIVFTNHTLVAAGTDVFSFDLVVTYLAKYAEQIKVPVNEVIKLGKIEDSSLFSMNMVALRAAGKTNAVSQFHADKAKELWRNHPLIPITNGIHLPRWFSPRKAALSQETDQASLPAKWWQAHQADKNELVEYVKRATGQTIRENSLIITWARRFVEYKRPLALFWQLDSLEYLIKKAGEQGIHLHFVYAGKLHPHNNQGKDLLAQVINVERSPRFYDNVTFVPNYNLKSARFLVSGSDVWLNTPIEGFEACGTSGMKAALNGVLSCSTNDGWVREVNWQDLGWVLDSDHISESIYSTIEQQILPCYVKRTNGMPDEWIGRMIKSSQLIREKYSASRMLDDYYAELYGVMKA